MEKVEQQQTAADSVDSEDEEDYDGWLEEDIQAVREKQEQEKRERDLVMLQDWDEFVKDTESRNQFLAAEQAKQSGDA